MKKIILLSIVILLFLAWSSDNSTPKVDDDGNKIYKEVSGRLSSAVSFIHSDNEIEKWLQEPGEAFVEAYVYFEDDLSESTIMGIDMEMLEGMTDPINFEGADWMALVGLQRSGKVWMAE